MSTQPNIFIFRTSIFFLCSLLLSPQRCLIIAPDFDFLSLSLIILSFWLTKLIIISNFIRKNFKFLALLFKLILLALSLSFSAYSYLIFYTFFEASLIPIFLIIMTIGYQPERLLARIIIFFYTLASSFPLLASLLIIQITTGTLRSAGNLVDPLNYRGWLNFSLISAFLVKFPIFLVHLWLPKAHVEAPVSGSMILAGVLLKLGGYGLFRLTLYFFWSPLNLIFSILSGVGGRVLGLLCCRVRDIKVLIAYSSVVHMSLIIINLLRLRILGLAGVWWIMLAHGVVSSGLFAGANLLYERSHSRRILVNKAGLTFRPIFRAVWFILIVINFAGPFSLNLFGEIILIVGATAFSRVILILVRLISFFSAAYGIILYSSTHQGAPRSRIHYSKFFNIRELLIIVSHVWPVLLILLGLRLY